ncbi:hypothetical protein BKA70DRAFT_1403086 [Coprinopsis sp. MPI-PUGE-AT-0042]|nr:hypothetical protein BKA70DRAFT_1403086 [Coprinopsis sp. MPI-PUGE-AT-0042]
MNIGNFPQIQFPAAALSTVGANIDNIATMIREFVYIYNDTFHADPDERAMSALLVVSMAHVGVNPYIHCFTQQHEGWWGADYAVAYTDTTAAGAQRVVLWLIQAKIRKPENDGTPTINWTYANANGRQSVLLRNTVNALANANANLWVRGAYVIYSADAVQFIPLDDVEGAEQALINANPNIGVAEKERRMTYGLTEPLATQYPLHGIGPLGIA